jgi:homogentisate 1,2-dioxygenase
MYTFNADMARSCLANADGDLLLVPQMGELRVTTEMGVMWVPPGRGGEIRKVRAKGSGCRVYGCGFRVWDSGFRV